MASITSTPQQGRGLRIGSEAHTQTKWKEYWASPDLLLDSSELLPGAATTFRFQSMASATDARANVSSRTTESSAPFQWARHVLDQVLKPWENPGQTRSQVSCVEHGWEKLAPPYVAAGLATLGFLLGMPIAISAGLGHGAPSALGTMSALFAAGGTAACVMAMGTAPSLDTVDMPSWVLFALACLCSTTVPLPLAPVSKISWTRISVPICLALPGTLGAIVMFEIGHRRWAHIDPRRVSCLWEREQEPRHLPDICSGFSGDFMSKVARHWHRHFMPSPGSDRGVGLAYLVSHLAVTFLSVQIDMTMTQWRNTFFNTLQAKNILGLRSQLWEFAPIALLSTVAGIYGGYLSTVWDLRWREEITRDFVSMWLEKRTYYHARFRCATSGGCIDNVDQRIVEDTSLFASQSRGLLCGAAEAALRLAVFGPALVRLSPSPLVWQACVALSLTSSIATHLVGRPLMSRSGELQQAEANLRSGLMRLRLYSEEIALQRGETTEATTTANHFEDVKAAVWLAARGSLGLTTFTSAYGLVSSIVPFLVLVPSYVHGDINLGLMFQLEAVVGGVRQSLDYFVGAYEGIALWRASAGRLLALEEARAVEDAIALREDGPGEEPGLRALDLTVHGPSGELLLDKTTFLWRKGERIALLGAEGSGKSSLLRMLAGARTQATSSRLDFDTLGNEVMLVRSSGFLLPMKATLRRCLVQSEDAAPPDEELLETLRSCGLSIFEGRLDEEADWDSRLTRCERQRLAFARLIAQWPEGVTWLFLDDIDCSISSEVARNLHDLVSARAPENAGIVITSRHAQVLQRPGWRRFILDPGRKALVEEVEEASVAYASTGEAPVLIASSSVRDDAGLASY